MSRLSGNCCCLSTCFNQAQKRPWSKHLHVQWALSSLTEKPACNTRLKQLQYLSCQQQQHLQIQSSAQTVPEVNGQLHLLAPNQKSALQNTPGTEKGFPALLYLLQYFVAVWCWSILQACSTGMDHCLWRTTSASQNSRSIDLILCQLLIVCKT